MKIVYSLFILFLAVSCSKEGDNGSLMTSPVNRRIKKITNRVTASEKVFIYNKKGLLTNINNTEGESFEILYNSSNQPVRINPYNQGKPTQHYYSITWGNNQFTYTLMSSQYNYSETCYTDAKNRIDKVVTKITESGKELLFYQNCTWFGNDSVQVINSNSFNQSSTSSTFNYYPYYQSIFKNIDLSVLIITNTTLLGMGTYQNNWQDDD